MHSALKKMADAVQNTPSFLEDISSRNEKKMIGYFHPVFPGEILYAAGLHPVHMSGFVLDKKEHTRMMVELLSHIEETAVSPEPSPVRLLLSGGCVLDTRLLDIISNAGAKVVADDFNNGARSFQPIVAEGEDALESLAGAYITVPCGFNTAIKDRFSFMADTIAEYAVDGVLFAINRNCETEKFDYPILDQKIRERFNIPTMLIETDYQCAVGPLQTRVEAFIEMIGGKER